LAAGQFRVGGIDVASIDTTPTAKAVVLLENVRRTPLVHGRLRDARAALRWNIAKSIEDCSVPQRRADRIAFQLVLKFGPAAVGDRRTWRALGELFRRDVDRLKNHVGLVERQIVVALPKLSAHQIENLLEELRTADPTIARTILDSALDAVDPGRLCGVTSPRSTRLGSCHSGTLHETASSRALFRAGRPENDRSRSPRPTSVSASDSPSASVASCRACQGEEMQVRMRKNHRLDVADAKGGDGHL
jgi:hypothetical protein